MHPDADAFHSACEEQRTIRPGSEQDEIKVRPRTGKDQMAKTVKIKIYSDRAQNENNGSQNDGANWKKSRYQRAGFSIGLIFSDCVQQP